MDTQKWNRYKQLISNDELEEAMNGLVKEKLPSLEHGLLRNMQGRLTAYNQANIDGVLLQDQATTQKNQIRRDFLTLLDQIITTFQKGGVVQENHTSLSSKELTTIPRPPRSFVGREKDMEAIEQYLEGRKPVLLLNGLGGIGKTTLASYYVEEHQEEYEYICWISVVQDSDQKKLSSTTCIQAFANAAELSQRLGVKFNPQLAEKERAIRILKALKQISGKCLLVIDNTDSTVLDLFPELPKTKNWHVLLTSREKLSPFKTHKLGELNPNEAEELFYELYEDGKDYKEDVQELLKYIEYHTLSVELFARVCENNPLTLDPANLLKKLKTRDLSTLDKEVWVGRDEKAVKVYSYLLEVFELSNLSDDEKALLTQWAILPSEGFSKKFIPKLFSVKKEEELEVFEKQLMQLVQKGWLSFHRGSFRIHQMIQEVIRDQLQPNEENCEDVIKGVRNLLHFDQNKENPADFFQYIPLGDMVLSHLPNEGEDISLLQDKLGWLYFQQGQYHKSKELFELALASDLKTYGEEHPDVATMRNELALVYDALGQYEKAIELYELALASDLKTYGGEHPNVAARRNNLALVYDELGQYEQAIELYELSLASDLKTYGEEHPNVAISKDNLGKVYWSLGQYEKAKKLHQEALASYLKTYGEEHPYVATGRNNLASVLEKLGQYKEALKEYLLTLKIYIKTFGEEHPWVAIAKGNIGLLYEKLNQQEKALTFIREAYNIRLKVLGDEHPYTQQDKQDLDRLESKQ